MKCESIAESMSVEDGIAQIGFDLTGSAAAYLVISRPCDAKAKREFFGEDHYVEVGDQLHGGYGTTETLQIDDDSRFHLRLKKSVPDVGHDLTIATRSPMSDAEYGG